MGWCTPIVHSIEELEQNMLLNMKGRGLKLFGGETVKKDGVVTSGHWICYHDWDRFRPHALSKGIPTKGTDGMKAFYTFVRDDPECCGFTCVGQLMDETQYGRRSWRLHTLAKVLEELGMEREYDGSATQRQLAVRKLPKTKPMSKMGVSVASPTIWRRHGDNCKPRSWKSPAVPCGIGTDQVSSSSLGDDESLTSATGLRQNLNKKQISHAPSSR